MILLTGGGGFIGSHTAVELINAGFEVVIADDLSNSRADVISRIGCITGKAPLFYQN
jgi:UDP-glucose 4-epimerase